MSNTPPPVPDRASKRTVLCIEDEPETISLVKLILERKGFRVIGALDGLEGLDLARQVDPDLVLLDLLIPGIDGWEVNRRMKADEQLRDVPVIVLTGVHRTGERAQDLQVDDYITKPFSPKDLVRRVREAVHVVTRETASARESSRATSGPRQQGALESG
jgi:DNA-binding response OmpR family regulator